MNRRNALQVLATAVGMMQIPGHALDAKAGMDQSITTRKIPSSGELLPVLGLGTWQTFDVGTDSAARAPLESVLREFSAMGGKLIDSSPMYGRSEEVAGDLIAKLGLREKLWTHRLRWPKLPYRKRRRSSTHPRRLSTTQRLCRRLTAW